LGWDEHLLTALGKTVTPHITAKNGPAKKRGPGAVIVDSSERRGNRQKKLAGYAGKT
jgi:hypothetical protein